MSTQNSNQTAKNVQITVGKGDKAYQPENLYFMQLSLFSAFVATLLKEFNEAVTFPIFGAEVTIPAASATNDKGIRFWAVAKIAALLLFNGMENDTPLPKENTEGHEFLDGLREAGLKFTHRTKSGILQAIKIKQANKSQRVGLIKDATNTVNKVTIQETDTIKEVRKVLKDKGIEAARKLIETKKQLGLPPMELTK